MNKLEATELGMGMDMGDQTVRIGNKAYRVRTQIVVEEVDAHDVPSAVQARERTDGSYELLLPEADACNIDKAEQAILGSAWPAMRAALSRHLSAASKKKPKSR